MERPSPTKIITKPGTSLLANGYASPVCHKKMNGLGSTLQGLKSSANVKSPNSLVPNYDDASDDEDAKDSEKDRAVNNLHSNVTVFKSRTSTTDENSIQSLTNNKDRSKDKSNSLVGNVKNSIAFPSKDNKNESNKVIKQKPLDKYLSSLVANSPKTPNSEKKSTPSLTNGIDKSKDNFLPPLLHNKENNQHSAKRKLDSGSKTEANKFRKFNGTGSSSEELHFSFSDNKEQEKSEKSEALSMPLLGNSDSSSSSDSEPEPEDNIPTKIVPVVNKIDWNEGRQYGDLAYKRDKEKTYGKRPITLWSEENSESVDQFKNSTSNAVNSRCE